MAQNQAQAPYRHLQPIAGTPFSLGVLDYGAALVWGAGQTARRHPKTFRTEAQARREAMLALIASPDMCQSAPQGWIGVEQCVPSPAAIDGTIYFIAGERNGAIKIGFTANLAARLEALQACSPVRLTVLATTPGQISDERAYHRRFAAHRLHGEWFARHPDILAEAQRISGQKGVA